MLKSKGWTVRKIQMFNGCYEVYGFDEKGRPVEAFFDPQDPRPRRRPALIKPPADPTGGRPSGSAHAPG